MLLTLGHQIDRRATRSQAKGQLKSTFFWFVFLLETHTPPLKYYSSHSHTAVCSPRTANGIATRQLADNDWCSASSLLTWSGANQSPCLLRGN